MHKTIVVDDEWYNLEETSERVENTGHFQVIGKYQNPLVALKEAAVTLPQVAFIDIELPEMDGITLAEKLLEINATIIIVFITSYNQYAVQAFDLNAMDYILKPIKSERFDRMVEKIKNEIGYRAQNTPSTIKIKIFGNFNVTVGDIAIKWQRIKAKELFAYLLVHDGEFIHKEKIIENIWPEYEQERALKILQTSVCKIRNLFSQVKIKVLLDYSNNSYCLTIKDSECDYFQVNSALQNYNKDHRATYEAIIKAASLYSRGLLIDEGYLWSMERDQQIRVDLLSTLKEILSVVTDEGHQDTIKAVLKLITKLSPIDEEINYMLIKLYQKTGDQIAAYNHYQWLEKTLREEYDIGLSARLQEFGQIITR